MRKRGRKRTVSHSQVVAYALRHAHFSQAQVASRFGITQCRVSAILRQAGEFRQQTGRPIKKDAQWTDEQYEWEVKLHKLNLGMDRGLRLDNERVLYGYDPQKQEISDHSAT